MQNLGEIFRYDHFNSTGFSFVAIIYFYRYEKQNKHMIYAFCILILLGRNVRNRMLVRFFTKSWQYHSLTRKNICAKNYLQLSLSKTKQCTHHFLRWYIQKCKAKTNEKVAVRLQNVLYNIWHILKKERAIQKRRAKNTEKKSLKCKERSDLWPRPSPLVLTLSLCKKIHPYSNFLVFPHYRTGKWVWRTTIHLKLYQRAKIFFQ